MSQDCRRKAIHSTDCTLLPFHSPPCQAVVAPGTDTSAAEVQLLQMMTGYWVSQGVYVAAKLGIADHLATGPVHYEDLARKTNTHALSLYRTLRALASVGVFADSSMGLFSRLSYFCVCFVQKSNMVVNIR